MAKVAVRHARRNAHEAWFPVSFGDVTEHRANRTCAARHRSPLPLCREGLRFQRPRMTSVDDLARVGLRCRPARCLFASLLTGHAPGGTRQRAQTFESNRLIAIATYAVCAGVESTERSVDSGQRLVSYLKQRNIEVVMRLGVEPVPSTDRATRFAARSDVPLDIVETDFQQPASFFEQCAQLRDGSGRSP